MISTLYELVLFYTFLQAFAYTPPGPKQSRDAALALCCVHTHFMRGKCVSWYHGQETADQYCPVCYRVRSWKPCVLQRLTSILYTVVMVPMTSALPWHLLLEMWCWQERCVTVTYNSAAASAAAVM